MVKTVEIKGKGRSLSIKKCEGDLCEGLVVFDVEGVLLPKWRYIPFESL